MSPNGHIYRAAFFGTSRKLQAVLERYHPSDDKILNGIKACSGPCEQGKKACPCPEACQIREADILAAFHAIIAALLAMLAFALLMLWSEPTRAADGETAATIAAAADTGTTVAAIATGAGVEANAAMAHPVAFVALSAGKILAPRLTRGMEPETRATVLRSWTTVWGAAAVNNLAVLAGAGCPPCLGVAAGVALWIHGGKRDPEPITAPEADAQLAMAAAPEVMP